MGIYLCIIHMLGSHMHEPPLNFMTIYTLEYAFVTSDHEEYNILRANLLTTVLRWVQF